MGNTTSPSIKYATALPNSKEDGYTEIYRNPKYIGELQGPPINPDGDAYNSVGDVWRYNFKNYPDTKVVGWRHKSGLCEKSGSFVNTLQDVNWNWLSFRDIEIATNEIGTAINKLNLCPVVNEYKDYKLRLFGTMSINNKSMVVLDSVASCYGLTSVPLYDTQGVEAVEHMFQETNLATVFCDFGCTKKLIDFYNSGSCPSVKDIIVVDEDVFDANINNRHNVRTEFRRAYPGEPELLVTGETENLEKLSSDPSGDQISKLQNMVKGSVKIRKFSNIFKECGTTELDKQNLDVGNNDIYTFSYTSGTTSAPKGAMMSHKNILTMLRAVEPLAEVEGELRHVSYLPLAHVYERVMMNYIIWRRGKYAIFNGVSARVMEDLSSIKPTLFASVPKFFNTVHGKIMTNTGNLQGVGKNLFRRGYASKLEKLKATGIPTHAFWDTLIFNKIKESLGGSVQVMITASAPIKGEVLQDLKVFFCCPCIEAYGQTEGCGGEFSSHRYDNEIGHVGGPCSVNEFRLKDVPDMKYLSSDVDEQGRSRPRGEILVRGGNVIPGYYKQEAKTRENIDAEGWLMSGDIGSILPGSNALKITDRQKNIFKLSFGEYIAPEKQENSIKSLKEIEDIFITGDSTKEFVVGIVCIEPKTGLNLAKSIGIEANDFVTVSQNKEFLKYIKDLINEVQRGDKHQKYEMQNHFYITPKIFGEYIEEGLTTSTFKLKRNIAGQLFKSQIDQMYGN